MRAGGASDSFMMHTSILQSNVLLAESKEKGISTPLAPADTDFKFKTLQFFNTPTKAANQQDLSDSFGLTLSQHPSPAFRARNKSVA